MIDFALLTSQASKVKITQSSILLINLERIHACYLLPLYLFAQIGFCCAYLIFISENLSTYVPVSKFILLLLKKGSVLKVRNVEKIPVSRSTNWVSKKSFFKNAVRGENLLAPASPTLPLPPHPCQGHQPICHLQVVCHTNCTICAPF